MLPAAVLFDFTGTLFHIESAGSAVRVALGPEFVPLAPRLQSLGAINGSGTSSDLPDELAEAWRSRDLSAAAHRTAYSGLAVHAGLTAAQADRLYERGLDPRAWSPYPDTVEVLRRLHSERVPVALVSNIGWDPRPVLEAYGVTGYFDVLVLSDERGVMKPDPEIFRLACAELDVAPSDAVMIGDSPDTDGGATALGCRFVLVPAAPSVREPDGLLRAVGLVR